MLRRYIEIIFVVCQMMTHLRTIVSRPTIQISQILEKWRWCMKKGMKTDGKVSQVQIIKKLLLEHRSESSSRTVVIDHHAYEAWSTPSSVSLYLHRLNTIRSSSSIMSHMIWIIIYESYHMTHIIWITNNNEQIYNSASWIHNQDFNLWQKPKKHSF